MRTMPRTMRYRNQIEITNQAIAARQVEQQEQGRRHQVQHARDDHRADAPGKWLACQVPRRFVTFDQVKHQRHDQQYTPKLATRNQRAHRDDQVQHVTDGAHGLEGLEPSGRCRCLDTR
jgi:hypothetical protein